MERIVEVLAGVPWWAWLLTQGMMLLAVLWAVHVARYWRHRYMLREPPSVEEDCVAVCQDVN